VAEKTKAEKEMEARVLDFEKKFNEKMAELEAVKEALEEREANLKAREEAQARSRSPATIPKVYVAPEDVKKLAKKAADYLAEHYYRPGQREVQMIEAIMYAASKHPSREQKLAKRNKRSA